MSRILVESTMLSGLKFASAPDTAKLLQILALCYAAENLTDGYITESAARKLTKARASEFKKAIEHLTTVQPGCKSPSWEVRDADTTKRNAVTSPTQAVRTSTDRVFFLHDYDDPLYDNPLKAGLEKRRVQKAEAGHQGGKRSAEVRQKKYGTARPLNSAREADPEAPSRTTPEAGASGGASQSEPPKLELSPEADAKLARAGARAQPFPSLPLPSIPDRHGDSALLGGNGTAAATSPSAEVQVLRLLDWFMVKRGWSTWESPDVQKREAQQAIAIIELGLPYPDLIAVLDAMWSATDPDDRPSSLKYFWTRLQDQQHATSKQQRSHASSELTKLKPMMPRKAASA